MKGLLIKAFKSHRYGTLVARLAIFVTPLLLTACANMSAGNLFSHYSAQTKKLHQDVANGDIDSAQQLIAEQDIAGPILDNMEKGRVALLAEDYSSSLQAFTISDQAVIQQQRQAVISVSEAANSTSALMSNDNVTSYEPADYELGYLHLYLAFNYIKNNDLNGALVEVRRANQVQEQAQKRRREELQNAEQDMKNNGTTPNLGSVLSRYPDAGKTQQAVQNAYLLYLSGLLYEVGGQPNDAYIDYKRALAVYPQNPQIIQASLRLATRLNMRQDLVLLRKQYGDLQQVGAGQGQVIILQEQGVVQARAGWRLSMPIWSYSGQGGVYNLALPYYPEQKISQMSPLRLDSTTLPAAKLADTNLMAQRDLNERIPAMVLRQALRLFVKDQIRREAARQDDTGLANFVANVWNIMTEQPDTRSWQTLPALVYSHSINLDAGPHTIEVDGEQIPIEVRENRITLVWLSRQGGNVTSWYKQLGGIR